MKTKTVSLSLVLFGLFLGMQVNAQVITVPEKVWNTTDLTPLHLNLSTYDDFRLFSTTKDAVDRICRLTGPNGGTGGVAGTDYACATSGSSQAMHNSDWLFGAWTGSGQGWCDSNGVAWVKCQAQGCQKIERVQMKDFTPGKVNLGTYDDYRGGRLDSICQSNGKTRAAYPLNYGCAASGQSQSRHNGGWLGAVDTDTCDNYWVWGSCSDGGGPGWCGQYGVEWVDCATDVACPAIPVNGACGSSNNQYLITKPTTNLCGDGSVPTVSGAGPWTWTCAGSNGGSNAYCTTLAVGACPIVSPTSTVNYSCSLGGSFENLSTCNAGCIQPINSSGSGGSDDPSIAAIRGIFGSGNQLKIQWTDGSLNRFTDSVTVPGCSFSGSAGGPDPASSMVRGIYGNGGNICVQSTDGGLNKITQCITSGNCSFSGSAGGSDPASYAARGVFGGGSMIGLQWTDGSLARHTDYISGNINGACSSTYACSNVCSSIYNNIQTAFSSNDASCTTPTGPVTYSLNCSCGISATKIDLGSINSSSCTSPCTNTPSFILTLIAGNNTKIEDIANDISAINENKTYFLASGTAVTLAATPASGSTLDLWSGDTCSGSASTSCSFSMTQNRTVVASAIPPACTDNCGTTQCGQVCVKADCSAGTGANNCGVTTGGWREVAP